MIQLSNLITLAAISIAAVNAACADVYPWSDGYSCAARASQCNESWMTAANACQNTCNKCPTTDTCSDVYPWSDGYSCAARSSQCNESWMTAANACQKTCNKCPSTGCTDVYPWSDGYSCAARVSQCNESWMTAASACQKTCGKCSGGVTTTTTKTTTTTAGGGGGAVGTPYTAPDGGFSSSGNPYAGVKRFVNGNYVQEIEDSIKQSTDATYIAKARKVQQYPTFFWLDTISAISKVPAIFANATAQGGSSDIIVELVVYDLPGRDCHALASNGEIPAGGLTKYKTEYIDAVYNAFKNKPSNIVLVLVIEPDSLPNLATNLGTEQCTSTYTAIEYPDGVAYAIAKLSVLPKTYLYVDAAHGGWLGWNDNQQKIIPIFKDVLAKAKAYNSAATIRGWSSTVANYDPFVGNGVCPTKTGCQNGQLQGNSCIDENIYTNALNTVFSPQGLPTRWIVDTGRSGVNGIRTAWGSWCNIKGAGIGERPKTNPAAQVDAFVWVKPPGESDGVSGPPGTPRLDGFCDPTTSNGQDSLSGAPQAGQWFDAQFKMLVANANPAL